MLVGRGCAFPAASAETSWNVKWARCSLMTYELGEDGWGISN